MIHVPVSKHKKPFASADFAALLQAEKERDRFFNVTSNLLVKAGFDGYFKQVNPAWEEILGWTLEELTQNPWVDFLHPNDVEATKAAAIEAFRGKELTGLMNRYRCKDGSYRWLLWKTQTVLDEEVIYCAATDITEIREAEAKLLESEKEFRQIANSIPQLAWMADDTGELFWFNQRWYDYTGCSFEEMEGLGWHKLHDPTELQRVVTSWKEALESGEPYEEIFPLRRFDGAMRWHLTLAKPIKNDQGKVVRWFGTNTDIEDQRNSAKAHQAKDLRLHTALQAGKMGTWELDIEREFLSCSKTCHQNYGIPEDEELTFQKILTLVHEEDHEYWKSVIATAIETASDFEMEYRIRWPDHSIQWIYVRGNCTVGNDGKAAMLSGVSINITERKKLEMAAIEAQKIAEEANLAKSEFLANMSHEIRTPMNAVIGLASILGKSEGLTERQQEYVRTLQSSADSLLGLINDLLDISKIEARSIELEYIPFSIQQLLDEIVTMMEIPAREKGLHFAIEGENSSIPLMVGDETRIRQILVNLCSNAIKFTEKGSVTIRIHTEPSLLKGVDNVSFIITDTGIGIPQEKQEMIFQKFIQADSSINRKYGGTGLGLAITKTLTEIMNGTITLDSTAGAGSSFTVTLPLMRADNEEVSLPVVPVPAKEQAQELKHRVLLVEDFAANVLVAGTYLEHFGYDYDVVDNGYEAVEKAKTTPYLAILMDVQMHGINGFEATKLIRAHEAAEGTRHTPIIGMTAYALTGDCERCLAAGMDDYLSKPYNPDILKKKLADCLANYIPVI